MEDAEKGPGAEVNAVWVPGESVGAITFGNTIASTLPFINLAPCDHGGGYRDGVKHEAYCDEEDHWIVRTQDSKITGISCNSYCRYKNKNLLGLKVEECLSLLEVKEGRSPDETIWTEGGEQDIYKIDDLGAQIGARNGRVVCVIVSEIHDQDGETIIHPFRSLQIGKEGSQPEASAPVLAKSLTGLATSHSKLGNREEALVAAKEAVAVTRTLAKSRAETFSPELAMSLSDLANSLFRLGKMREALKEITEATEILVSLAKDNPEAFKPDLAKALNNRSNILAKNGKSEEALETGSEAAGLYRNLAKVDPVTFKPHLATSLSNLADKLLQNRKTKEALEAATEATQIRRALANNQPDTFTPNLAASLHNLANVFSKLGRKQEGLKAANEAVELYRSLANTQPKAFTPNLSTSLNNLANRLSELGRNKEASKAVKEAIEIRRALAEAEPEVFTFDLVMSLGAQSQILIDENCPNEAHDCLIEAMNRVQPFFVKQSAAFAGVTAKLYRDYINCCKELEIKPNDDLLDPIVAVFQKMKRSNS